MIQVCVLSPTKGIFLGYKNVFDLRKLISVKIIDELNVLAALIFTLWMISNVIQDYRKYGNTRADRSVSLTLSKLTLNLAGCN